jgi:hypothetical protein
MFSEIIVHFTPVPGGPSHRVIVTPGSDVKAIIIGDAEARRIANKLEIPRKKAIPKAAGMTVKDEKGGVVQMKAEAIGPDVCYMVGNELICW